MFGQLSNWVASAQEQVKKLSQESGVTDALKSTMELEEGYNEEEPRQTQATVSGSSSGTGAAGGGGMDAGGEARSVGFVGPGKKGSSTATAAAGGWLWTATPGLWQQQGKAREWTALVAALLDDENTFCIPLQRVLTRQAAQDVYNSHGVVISGRYLVDDDLEGEPSAAAETSQGTVLPPAAEGLRDEVDISALAKDAIALIEAYPVVNELRFKLVPRYCSEEKFWENFFGRLVVIGASVDGSSSSQLMALVTMLNTEPLRPASDNAGEGEAEENQTKPGEGPKPRGAGYTRRRNMGNLDNAAVLEGIADKVNAAALHQEWFDQTLANALRAIEQGTNSSNLLMSFCAEAAEGQNEMGREGGGGGTPGEGFNDDAYASPTASHATGRSPHTPASPVDGYRGMSSSATRRGTPGSIRQSEPRNSEFVDSVLESCKFHKTRVAVLLGEIESHSIALKGTKLDADDGEVARELAEVNRLLHDALEQAARIRGVTSSSTSNTSATPTAATKQQQSASTSSSAGTLGKSQTTPPSGGAASKTSAAQQKNPTEQASGRRASDVDPSTEFNAQLPWDDDEDF